MPPEIASLYSWILAGQSNMQGIGVLAEALPPDDRVWAFTMAGQWEVASEPLHPLWDSYLPVHAELMLPEGTAEEREAERVKYHENLTCGAGLGLAFGKALADALGTPIGLLPAAHGGTSLEQWSPSLKQNGGHSLYGAMLRRVADAGAPIQGLLWYQGCSDAFGLVGGTYAERMAAWIAAARADLNEPNLPVLLVQIGNFVQTDPNAPEHEWDLVREALAELPMRVPFCACTTAADLPLTDGIHLDTAGLIRLGRRMARQALHLTGHPEISAGPVLQSLEMTEAPNGLAVVRVRCSGLTGSWHPEKIFGFTSWTAEGERHPEVLVISASPDPWDPSAIKVLLNVPPSDERLAEVQLAYGMGFNPCCNAADDADMPLCAFLPRPIGWKR